jgi:hypothetical protein
MHWAVLHKVDSWPAVIYRRYFSTMTIGPMRGNLRQLKEIKLGPRDTIGNSISWAHSMHSAALNKFDSGPTVIYRQYFSAMTIGPMRGNRQ